MVSNLRQLYNDVTTFAKQDPFLSKQTTLHQTGKVIHSESLPFLPSTKQI